VRKAPAAPQVAHEDVGLILTSADSTSMNALAHGRERRRGLREKGWPPRDTGGHSVEADRRRWCRLPSGFSPQELREWMLRRAAGLPRE